MMMMMMTFSDCFCWWKWVSR